MKRHIQARHPTQLTLDLVPSVRVIVVHVIHSDVWMIQPHIGYQAEGLDLKVCVDILSIQREGGAPVRYLVRGDVFAGVVRCGHDLECVVAVLVTAECLDEEA